MDATALLKGIQQEARELTRELPFEAYLEKARRDPRLARLSHKLIHDMIAAVGTGTDESGRTRYDLFRDQLFGVDSAILQVVEYFAAAARRFEVRKRILLLVGPPGCGKSTLVNAVKQGLEDYTRTPAGAVYAIKGCPVYEDPLHLIPRHRRAQLKAIHVEGDLCPHCRWMVRNVYRNDVTRVPVQRFSFSAAEGIGLGTFVATDPGSEDLSRLVGTVDLSQLRGSTDRHAARQAYRLDGELNAANRGLADLIEVLKMDERFLSVLLTLSQEQVIKLSGRGIMYADEAIVAHSNIAEYEALVADPKAAALLDRLVVVHMGYALAVRDEVRIYEKMLGEAGLEETRMSPLALPIAATLAVLSRLSPAPGGWTLQRKLRFYDGRFVAGVRPEDLAAARSGEREDGSFGFSPRYVMNQISRALGRTEGCLTGRAVLDTLWEGLTQRAGFDEGQREAATEIFAAARAEYDELVTRAIRRALVSGFEKAATAKAREALRDLEAWSRAGGGDGLATLRQVERALDVPYYRREELRQALLARLRGPGAAEALHRADPRLEEAIERILLPSWGEAAAKLTTQAREKRSAARGKLRKALVEEWGCCDECAEDLIEHAAGLAGPETERRGVLRWRSS